MFYHHCCDEANRSFTIIIVINDYRLYSEMSSYVEFYNNMVLQFDAIVVPPYLYAVLANLKQH